jgi:hypothetical protein
MTLLIHPKISRSKKEWIHFSFNGKWINKLRVQQASKDYDNSDLKEFIDAFLALILKNEEQGFDSLYWKKNFAEKSSNEIKFHTRSQVVDLMTEIESFSKGLSLEEKEYHSLFSAFDDFRIDVKNNSYDNEVFIKVLIAAKSGNRSLYIKYIAKLSSCFPKDFEQDKSDFIQIFSYLFETKQFPSQDSRDKLCQLLGLESLTFPPYHYNS